MSINYYVNDRFCCYPRPVIPSEKPNKSTTGCHGYDGMKNVLEAILTTVYNMNKPEFKVSLEITSTTGVLYTVPVTCTPPRTIKLTESSLITDQINISICDIAKLHIISGTVEANKFNAMIQDAIKGNSITPNSNSFKIEKTFGAAINSVSLSTVSSDIVEAVIPSEENIVKSLSFDNAEVVTEFKDTKVTVSAPIIAAITPIVSQIDTITPDKGLITEITSSTSDAIDSVTPSTKKAITGFGKSKTVTGVISGVKSLSITTPTPHNIPSLSCPNTGIMQVTLPKGVFDGINPVDPIVLNVQIGGENVYFNGNKEIYALNSDHNLLGSVSGNPEVTNIPVLGKATTDSFVYDIKTTTSPLIDSINSQSVNGSLVENVNNEIVNTIATPTTVDVLEEVNVIKKSIPTISDVETIKSEKLFNTATKKMVSSVLLSSTAEKYVTDISTETLQFTDGESEVVRDGIVTISDCKGDTTIYSDFNRNHP